MPVTVDPVTDRQPGVRSEQPVPVVGEFGRPNYVGSWLRLRVMWCSVSSRATTSPSHRFSFASASRMWVGFNAVEHRFLRRGEAEVGAPSGP